jgi:hypothetical protein
MSKKSLVVLALFASLMMVGSAYAAGGPQPSSVTPYIQQYVKMVYGDLSNAERVLGLYADLFEPTKTEEGFLDPVLDGTEEFEFGGQVKMAKEWRNIMETAMDQGWTWFENGKLYRAQATANLVEAMAEYMIKAAKD